MSRTRPRERTTVGRMLGHRNRVTTAIYAYLDDAALRDAAAQAAFVIARAMNYDAEPPPLPEEETKDAPTRPSESAGTDGSVSPDWQGTPLRLGTGSSSAETTQPKPGCVSRFPTVDGRRADPDSDKANEDDRERRRHDLLWI